MSAVIPLGSASATILPRSECYTNRPKRLSHSVVVVRCSALSRRQLAASMTCSFTGFFLLGSSGSAHAILEADDDEELLEKVKADRKKRLQKQQQAKLLNNEAGYVQEAVYKLSEVGQAIENNDFNRATTILGSNLDTKWIANVKEAFSKVSSDAEQKTKADTFTSSLASLISAVSKQNLDLCKSAFVASADALEDWSTLTGLSEQLKGL